MISVLGALDRSASRGWIQQVSGKGFSGSYRLMYPYYPTPAQLWGPDYVHTKKKEEKHVDKSNKGRAEFSDRTQT